MLTQEIEKVLNEYRVRCVHGKKIGISQEQATTALLEVFKKCVPEEKLTYEHRQVEIGGHLIKETDARYNAGFNDALADIKENLTKRR